MVRCVFSLLTAYKLCFCLAGLNCSIGRKRRALVIVVVIAFLSFFFLTVVILDALKRFKILKMLLGLSLLA